MAGFQFPSDIPFSVQELRNEFDRLVDRVWHGGLSTAPLDGQDWAPRMDVAEQTDGYLIRVEIPGVTPEDIEVSILKPTLTIKGTKRAPENVTEGGRIVRRECRFGSFCRKAEFDSPVDENSVSANFKDGVLFVRVSKAQEAMGRRVKVAAQESHHG